MSPQVLFEDNHCLAVMKPAGMLTMGDDTGDETMVDWAREYLRAKYHKPGKVFVGVVHRLDRPVSGILLLARTSKGASRLSEQFRNRSVRKVYRALVEGCPAEKSGEFFDQLLKSSDQNRTRVVSPSVQMDEGSSLGKEARLRYSCLKRHGKYSLLEVELLTGRSHQIRVQLSSRGLPICGDAKYGARTRLNGCLALHAAKLVFDHPTLQSPITIFQPEPDVWNRWLNDPRVAWR